MNNSLFDRSMLSIDFRSSMRFVSFLWLIHLSSHFKLRNVLFLKTFCTFVLFFSSLILMGCHVLLLIHLPISTSNTMSISDDVDASHKSVLTAYPSVVFGRSLYCFSPRFLLSIVLSAQRFIPTSYDPISTPNLFYF